MPIEGLVDVKNPVRAGDPSARRVRPPVRRPPSDPPARPPARPSARLTARPCVEGILTVAFGFRRGLASKEVSFRASLLGGHR